MKDFIATLEVIAVFKNGREVGLTARIGRAAPQDGAWLCPVELSPVYGEPMSVKGVDSFHATWLACSLVLKLLGHLKAEGWRAEGRPTAARSPSKTTWQASARAAQDAEGG